jgi:hypothetical protein
MTMRLLGKVRRNPRLMAAREGSIMRAAVYLGVSTDEQTTDNQERELRASAERAGLEVVAVYRDAGISGAKGP